MEMSIRKEEGISRFMSYALRHNPSECGLLLNQEGFCPLSHLLEAIHTHTKWKDVTEEEVRQVVANCEKQRYEMQEDVLIRARYGHSNANIYYQHAELPPATLLHGTNEKVKETLLSEGILPMKRKYVHLSETPVFASQSGRRKGELVLLEVDTVKAVKSGTTFYYGGGEVWLATAIAPSCVKVYENKQ